MGQEKALIRELIERIEGVDQTWFELEIEGSSRKKTLVVEVGFDSDIDGTHALRTACDEIERTYKMVIGEENADAVSKLKIVNKSATSSERHSNERPSVEKPLTDRSSGGRLPGEIERRSQRAPHASSSGPTS
jgi:hypothetical protein